MSERSVQIVEKIPESQRESVKGLLREHSIGLRALTFILDQGEGAAVLDDVAGRVARLTGASVGLKLTKIAEIAGQLPEGIIGFPDYLSWCVDNGYPIRDPHSIDVYGSGAGSEALASFEEEVYRTDGSTEFDVAGRPDMRIVGKEYLGE
jgi:hypothetical protein